MDSVVRFAADGGLVFGICNGFQVLCETGLLPGALIRNRGLSFVCRTVHCRVEETDTPFTRGCSRADVLALPIKHGEGCQSPTPTPCRARGRRQIVLRYVDSAGRTTERRTRTARCATSPVSPTRRSD
jgi:phosphoribosylformylglycinamidine synthase